MAAIILYALFYIGLPVFLLITAPKLIGRNMRQIWNAQGKRAFIEEKLPYYKDPIVYLPVLVISLVILGGFYCLLLFLLGNLLYP